MALTADGRIISGSGDGRIRVWDLESGRLLRSLNGHTGSVEAVVVTVDGLSSLAQWIRRSRCGIWRVVSACARWKGILEVLTVWR